MKVNKEQGITLVALIITIIVLIILAAVTIYAVVESSLVDVATKGTENYSEAQVDEIGELDATVQKLEETVSNIVSLGGDTTTPEQPKDPKPEGTPTSPIENWDKEKVYEVKSEDNIILPVPIGFTTSDEIGEKSVDNGFVIKKGVNEFVWVPVPNITEMFGTDEDGNSLGKLYDFSSETPTALNWEETDGIMSWSLIKGTESYREPDSVPSSDDFYVDEIGLTNAAELKKQLQIEFNQMKKSVKTYGGFYVGRYETGNLLQEKAVVAKGNEELTTGSWYTHYQKNKTIIQETEASSSMIWGCQWDAIMRWFLQDNKTKEYVTNSKGANYSTNKIEATGYYGVKNIYDMAGNMSEWTIEACNTSVRLLRGGDASDKAQVSPASKRVKGNPNAQSAYYGSRATLIIY